MAEAVDSTVEVGQYLAVPFVFNPNREHINDAILQGCARLPLFPLPTTHAQRLVEAATWVTNPANLVWEVWRGGDLCGILVVSRIVRGLDALVHFAFFDRQLYGRRLLVLTMMGWCFRELDLRRLSVEIPDHLDPLVRFARTKLGFRFEGEGLAAGHQIVQALPARRRGNGPARWVAKWGSRRERSHWDGERFRDIVCLRVLREEFTMP